MAQNNTIHNILEVVVGTADIRSSNQVKSGKLRKIATRIYTSNMDDAPEDIIRRNVLSRVRQFSANIIGEDFEETRRYLEGTNAFKDGDEYILRF